MWIEARKLIFNEHRKYDGQANMSLSNFYGAPTSSGYCFWLDLRSTDDDILHGNRMKIEPGSHVVLNFTKNNTGSNTINVHTYLIADSSSSIINRYATDLQY